MKKINIIILFLALLFLVGFTKSPQKVYRVYLAGKSLGLVKDKKELEDYIDSEQKFLKKKYNVDKVYAPDDLDIKKEITYDNKILSTKEIYEKIKNKSPFTIKGYAITIKGIKTQNSEGKTTKSANQIIYVIDKSVFTDSIKTTIKSFISEDSYNAYINNTQKEIKDTGSIIENIYIKNNITIKKQNIPVNQTIYTKVESLSKYLLFGTTNEQQKYTVQDGDTISDVAFNNKISNEEFLIANPTFKDANSLLFPGQIVTLGVLKPQFNLVEEDHVVLKEEKNYETETRYDDNKNFGTSEVIQSGVKGENKVTQKVQKVNGEVTNVVLVSTESLKDPIKEIIVQGGKKSSYSGKYSGGYGSVVATRGEWGWPASCGSPATISSPFGWRWGTLHDGTDIAGCGYGSNIFAAQAGTVVQSSSKSDNGQYITIDHHNGYFTLYAHLCVGCRYVSVGQNVAKGQVIGGMGRTGAATGIHLHFAIWRGYPYRGGVAQNAMNYY